VFQVQGNEREPDHFHAVGLEDECTAVGPFGFRLAEEHMLLAVLLQIAQQLGALRVLVQLL